MKEHKSAIAALVVIALAGLGTVGIAAWALDRRTRRLFGPPFANPAAIAPEEYTHVLVPDPALGGDPWGPASGRTAIGSVAPELASILKKGGRKGSRKRD